MEGIIGKIIVIVLIILVLAVLATNIRVVPQSRAFVIERLGAFQTIWEVGLHFKIPFLERVAKNVSLKEQVVDFPPQPVITKDNVTMQIDTVIYFQITDPKLYTYGVENPMSAIENLTATTLRNIIGDLELDQSLTSRDHINSQMRAILDEATDNWGIKVNRVELKNIMPPRDIQESMEKQMRAERERREAILQAHPLGHPVQQGQLHMESHAPGGVIGPQALHHEGPGLLDHVDVGHQQDQYDNTDGDENIRHTSSSFLLLTHNNMFIRPLAGLFL